MSLFSSIRMAGNTLQADSIALQVVGQNIANANTPGYIREEVILMPGPTQSKGALLLGTGVQVYAVIQKMDSFLEERLRGAVSDQASAEAQEQIYIDLEGAIGELNDTDLSTSLNNFFSSIAEILNQPESTTVRNLAVLQGNSLANDIKNLAERVLEMRGDVNSRIQGMASDINRLVDQIRTLNLRITETEVGGAIGSDAVGLRDQRLKALQDLAQLVDIRVQEQDSGGVAVYCGGDYLVYEGVARHVEVKTQSDRGLPTASISLAQTGMPLDASGGQLHGLLAARDDVLGAFQDKLNDFAKTLINEFNKIYATGQGLIGYSDVVSEFAVDDATVPLNTDENGLEFLPVNGSFQVLVHNRETGLTQTTNIRVDLNGLGEDTTLEDLARQLDDVDGISAVATATGKLEIRSDGADQEFAFANDTSEVLAALGINTFFSGSSAVDIGINGYVREDPSKFAASGGGIGSDTSNAVTLASFQDRPLASQHGNTLADVYDRMVGDATQGSTIAQATAEGARTFQETLNGQKLATSGVNLDEEAIRMIGFQQSYQASARYIRTLSDLLETLVNL
jgi:flagellar hook-associated protein 1 FlgK